jgi:hypothetical protein
VRSSWLVLSLVAFTLACRGSNRVAQIGVGTKEREQTQKAREETSREERILARHGEEKESETISMIEQKPKKEKAAQPPAPDREPEKPPTADRQKSELMSRLEGVRPATPEEVAAEEWLMDEITGLIIEQTMTKIGYEFYEYFFLFWEAPQVTGIQNYNISINERASALWGSWVWIDVNGTTIWNSILRPRSAEVEEAAQEAVAATKEYLVNYDQYQFESEDLVGTGI